LLNGIYQQPENLGNAINSDELDYMPFIDPNEKYLIFKSNRSEGRGLYISFNDNGTWSHAMNMGDLINQNTYGSLWPYVTLDEEYFFFCAGLAQDVAFNPYWVRTSIIDSLRSIVSLIDEAESVPLYFQLNQNYPNPFNAETIISFELGQSSHIILEIYDLLGKINQTLLDRFYHKGIYSINFDAGSLSSGIYFYKLSTNNGYTQTKKMCVLK
jgi:hypothetical protein